MSYRPTTAVAKAVETEHVETCYNAARGCCNKGNYMFVLAICTAVPFVLSLFEWGRTVSGRFSSPPVGDYLFRSLHNYSTKHHSPVRVTQYNVFIV